MPLFGPTAPVVVSGGNLGSTETLNCAGNLETWLVGTLDANCTVTVSNLASGRAAKLLLTQDATGGRSLTVSDGTNSSVVTIPTTALAACEVDVASDGTNLYVDVAGGSSAAGAIPDTLLDAKGDLIVATAADTAARLAAGTNGHVLIADSSQTAGVKWGPGGLSSEAISGARLHKLKTWSYDPSAAFTGSAPTAGVLNVARVPWAIAATVSELIIQIGTAGSGATSLANCFVGIYDAAGTLLGKTADQAANWTSTGTKRIAITVEAGQSLTIANTNDMVYLAFLVGTQSTTNVQLTRNSNIGTIANSGLSASDPFRFFTLSTGLSALPSSITATSGAAGQGWVMGAN